MSSSKPSEKIYATTCRSVDFFGVGIMTCYTIFRDVWNASYTAMIKSRGSR